MVGRKLGSSLADGIRLPALNTRRRGKSITRRTSNPQILM
jgi:hypothetical protein